MIKELGEGAFGLVRLALDKKSGQMVAVKTVNMQKTVQMNKDKHVVREKSLLDSLRNKHSSIINLLSTFRVRLLHPLPLPFSSRTKPISTSFLNTHPMEPLMT